MSTSVLDRLAGKLRQQQLTLVMPEGHEERIVAAARVIRDRDLASIVLLGVQSEIEAAASRADVDLGDVTLLDPAKSEHLDSFATQYLDLRPDTKPAIARRLVGRPLFFAGSMVRAGQADAMLAGAASTTSRVIEACLMTIGLSEGIKTPSSCFLMLLRGRDAGDERALIFSDCAVVVEPSAAELADIALASTETARGLLDDKPRVAILSFSTKGSGKHPLARKVAAAAELAAKRAPHLAIDGELQADAALIERVARIKLDDPGEVAGRANVLVFPDLNTGNIAYKLTQALAGARALGPFLQGFARPVADLSRGATVDDIVATAIVTLARSLPD